MSGFAAVFGDTVEERAAVLASLDYLTSEERAELDTHLVALTSGRAHVEYRSDPVAWAAAMLGVPAHTIVWSLNKGYGRHAWDGDADPLARLFEAVRDGRNCGVESGTGTGKSFAMAVLILWFLACYEDSRVFTFAPKEDQLRLFIWAEIRKLWPRFHAHFPDAELLDLEIRMRGNGDKTWIAQGVAVGIEVGEAVSTKASGMHAQHMMLVYEEAQRVPLQVMEAGENACTAAHNFRVAIGNCNNRLDTLHRFATAAGTVHVRMSALDHPNVVTGNAELIPGAVSGESIRRRREKYGETSPVYQSRVRGISPEQASDALIRHEWLEASAVRYAAGVKRGAIYTVPGKLTGKGVDVANSEHGDRACIVDFSENRVVRVDAFQCPDANALGRQVVMELQAAELKAEYCGIDTIGVGAGTVNECRRLRQRVQGLNASSRPFKNTQKSPDGATYEWADDANLFRHFRDQGYWQLREDFRLGRIDMARDDELWEELTAHTFVDEPKTVIEPKDEVRARLGRSPDKAEALMLGNWARRRRAWVPEVKDESTGLSEGHDANVRFRRVAHAMGGEWVGPERAPDGDDGGRALVSVTGGYTDQLPVGI